MLYGMGKDGDPLSDQAWDYVDQFIANLDGKMANSSSQVYKGVAEGEYVVGLTWEDPAANYVKEGAAVEVVFPKEGAIFPGESVQILKDCKHPENAKKFVDYMLSEKIQNAVGSISVGWLWVSFLKFTSHSSVTPSISTGTTMLQALISSDTSISVSLPSLLSFFIAIRARSIRHTYLSSLPL